MAGNCSIFQQSVSLVPHLLLTMPHGGYLTFHHYEIRGITAQLMSEEVHSNVATEPTLQLVSVEAFSLLCKY